MTIHDLPILVAEYFSRHNYRMSTAPGHKNLLYLEGASFENGVIFANEDLPDRWNDLRIVLEWHNSLPFISHIARATCEPGTSATNSKQAQRLGGVARLQLTQYKDAAKMGHHKSPEHPALVQVGTILVHRDGNRDQKRTGDTIRKATGINHHSTRPGFKGERVGDWSAGCCVGWNWEQHLEFIEQLKTDPRYLADSSFAWDFAVIDFMGLK